MHSIDDVFLKIGGLGRRQWQYVVYLSILKCHYPFHMLLYNFVGRTNLSFQCRSSLDNSTSTLNHCDNSCDFKTFYPQDESSIIKEWDLTCDRAWMAPLTMSIFMFGVMLGAVVLGWISDAYGRKFTLFLTLICIIITNAMGAFCQNFALYTFTRMINGFFCGGHVLALIVLCNELIANSERGKAAAVMSNSWSLGMVLLSLLAYNIRLWRPLTTAISFFGLPFLILYFLLPESPRWLQSMNRIDEANKVLKVIAEGNGVSFTPQMYLKKEDHNIADKIKCKSGRILDLFGTWSLSAMTIIMMYSWFVNSAAYYGLTLVVGTDSHDLYMATALSGIVEVPSTFLSAFLLTYVGRRKPLAWFMIACGLSLFLIPISSSAFPFLVLSIALFGKLCISASFTIVYLHSSEIFPTYIRNTGMGLVAVTSRFGGIVSPYLARLGYLYPNLEFILFGFLSLSAGVLNLRLPETFGEDLPVTLSDLLKLLNKNKKRRNRKKSNSLNSTEYQPLAMNVYDSETI